MHLTLHLTGQCNFRCSYCYAEKNPVDMSFETAQKAIQMSLRMLEEKQSDSSLGIVFFGGEPLLRKPLIREIMTYCKRIETETKRPFHFKMTTNGMLLDEAFLTDPLTSQIMIALSHDGIPAAHDAHRHDVGGHPTSQKLDPVIDLLLKHQPYALVMQVVSPDTVPYYAQSVRYHYACGFRYLIYTLDFKADWNDKSFKDLAKQYKELAEWYETMTLKEKKFYFSPFDKKIASHIFPEECNGERCDFGKRQVSVAATGRIFPCIQFVGDGSDSRFCIGDVETGIDQKRSAKLYFENFAEKASCFDCAIKERCNQYCGCINLHTTGKINTVSPYLCAHERIVLPIADRLAEKLYKKRSAMFIQKQYNHLYPLLSLVEDRTR